MRKFKNIGFISTRIEGTDGVSLEIEKWATVLERNQFECFYFSGENDRPAERCMHAEEAHFEHPDILDITRNCFGRRIRPREVMEQIHLMKNHLKRKIYNFVRQFDIHVIIPENALAIPLNIPLAMALQEFIAETGFPTIAHHHDFSWERDRFLVNAVEDLLDCAFPPNLPTIQHVVINSLASEQLSHRKGISNTIVPNVYDFATPPPPPADASASLREVVGLEGDDLFILQPTRVVPRKWIERSLEIVKLMSLSKPTLVISHRADDEGDAYILRIQEYAKNLGVGLVSIEHLVGHGNNDEVGNERKFSIADVYQSADLITYPSGYEGFGNAFLEAVYFRKPVIVNRYSIYITDIEPKGFDVIVMDGFATQETISKVFEVLNDDERRGQMVEKNYALGNRYFSYEILEELLLHLIRVLEIQRVT